jgi:hypothetical protein
MSPPSKRRKRIFKLKPESSVAHRDISDSANLSLPEETSLVLQASERLLGKGFIFLSLDPEHRGFGNVTSILCVYGKVAIRLCQMSLYSHRSSLGSSSPPTAAHIVPILPPSIQNPKLRLLSQFNSWEESRPRKALRDHTLNINIAGSAVMRTPHLQQNKATTDRRVEFYRTLALIPLNKEPCMRSHQFASHCSHCLLRRNLGCFRSFG